MKKLIQRFMLTVWSLTQLGSLNWKLPVDRSVWASRHKTYLCFRM